MLTVTYSDITVDIGTHLKTVKNTLNIFAVQLKADSTAQYNGTQLSITYNVVKYSTQYNSVGNYKKSQCYIIPVWSLYTMIIILY